MSIMDEVASKLKTAFSHDAHAGNLVTTVLEYVQRPEVGGLPGLTKKFEIAGLGPTFQSWMGDKPLPITPEEITRVIGPADLNDIATKANVPADQAANKLTSVLPETIKHLAGGIKTEAFAGLGANVRDRLHL